MEKIRKIDFEVRLVAREDLPLFGKHILFTTPRNYAAIFARLLVERGAKPVWMPTIVIEPMEGYNKLDHSIDNLSTYDWVAFTSLNGIEAFFNRLHAKGLNVKALGNTKTCAIGAEHLALEKKGIKADLVPSKSSPKGIVEEFERRNIRSGWILLPVPEVIGMKEPRIIPDFVEGLSSLGMKVDTAPAYTTARVTEGASIEKKMLLNGEIDMVVFTSTAELDSLLSLLGNVKKILGQVTLASMDPFAAASAKELGLDVKIVPQDYSSFDGLLGAMEEYFQVKAK